MTGRVLQSRDIDAKPGLDVGGGYLFINRLSGRGVRP